MKMFEKKLQELRECKGEEVRSHTQQSGHRAFRRGIRDFRAELKSQGINCVERQSDSSHQDKLQPNRAERDTEGEAGDAQSRHDCIDHKAQFVHFEPVEDETDQK